MTPNERRHVAERLIEMQKMLRTVFEACETQATLCKDAGALRLAFSIAMVRESLISYSKELNTFVLKFMADEPLEEEELDFFDKDSY